MLDTIKYIEVKKNTAEGEKITKYPMAFTLNIMEVAQKKYGTYTKWFEKLDGGEAEVDMEAMIWTIESFINEGLDIENEDLEKPRPLITHKQAGRIISSVGMGKISIAIKSLVSQSVDTGESDPNEQTRMRKINQSTSPGICFQA